MQDDKLLTQYVRDGSQAAFSLIAARHLTLVYSTCLREIGSPTLAEDAAQVVFLLLARKAKSLHAAPSLAGWLYQTARFVAKDVRRQEARRQRREQSIVQEITHHRETTASEWEQIEPLLNDALSALKPTEREAVLLRFLEGYTLTETGMALGLSEDAARMRVSRAIDKMRRYLTAHGASVNGLLLTILLTSEAARPVPAHAADTITQGTLQTAAGLAGGKISQLLEGVLHTMWIKTATSLTAIAVAAVLTVSLAVASIAKITVTPKISQLSRQPTVGEYYADQQPPALETLMLPDATRVQSAAAGGGTPLPSGGSSLHIAAFTSPSSFRAVCQFYIDKLLPPGSKLGAIGVEGDLRKQSGYSLNEGQNVSAAVFTQRTAAYSISVSVHRGAQDKATVVTLIYGQS